jgi:hypothetical protein
VEIQKRFLTRGLRPPDPPETSKVNPDINYIEKMTSMIERVKIGITNRMPMRERQGCRYGLDTV